MISRERMTIAKHTLVTVLAFFAVSFTRSGELSAHVEQTYYLQGKIGQRAIAIKMLCYDEMPVRQVYYFFQDAKKDHFLTGKLKDGVWNFIAEAQQEKAGARPEIALNIRENKKGIWTGTWTDSIGKSTDIVLNPMQPDSISSKFSYLTFVKELDPYESYRLSQVAFTKTNTEKRTKDLMCDWYIEKESGVSFFRLRSSNKKLNTNNINAALETTHLSLVQKYFAFQREKVDTKVETSLTYLSNELVSFKVLSMSILKSSKSVTNRELFTLDVNSGQPANLEDIIWLDSAASKPPMDDLYKIYKYRKSVFAPKVFQLLQKLYPAKMKLDSCHINKVDSWILPAWMLTNNGIALSFQTPDDCNALNWAIIPYKNVGPFMQGKYHLKSK
jgi:hypothetical protein